MTVFPPPSAWTGLDEVGKRDLKFYICCIQLLEDLSRPGKRMQVHVPRDISAGPHAHLLVERLKFLFDDERRVIGRTGEGPVDIGNTKSVTTQLVLDVTPLLARKTPLHGIRPLSAVDDEGTNRFGPEPRVARRDVGAKARGKRHRGTRVSRGDELPDERLVIGRKQTQTAH